MKQFWQRSLSLKVVLTMALVMVVFVFIYSMPLAKSSESPTANGLDPQIITSPKDDDTVYTTNDVNGVTPEALPAERKMWLAINPQDKTNKDKWWPQGGEEIDTSNSLWSVNGAVFGNPCNQGGKQDNGKKYVIAVISVDKKGNDILVDWVKNGPRDNWPGIKLPAGTNIIDSITVTLENYCS